MKIGFWSNEKGNSCVTSSMVSFMLYNIIKYNTRAVCLQTHYSNNKLKDCLLKPSQKGKGLDSIYDETGIDPLFRHIVSKGVTKDLIRSCARSLMDNKLNIILPSEAIDQNTYNKHIKTLIKPVLEGLNKSYQMVLVDIDVDKNSFKETIDSLDLLVVCLSQNSNQWSDLFNNYDLDNVKVFYLINDYESSLRNNAQTFMRLNKNVNSKNFSFIPRQLEFKDSYDNSEVIKYFLKNFDSKTGDISKSYMRQLEKTSEKILAYASNKKEVKNNV